jgi:monoamine oxidase
MQTDTLIVGGGLAGVALAATLHAEGHDFQVLEARSRLGGRVHAARVDGAMFDLGPAWFWPHQPLMAAAAARFGLTVFEQFSSGDIVAQDVQGQVRRGVGFASMAGSLRISGGMTALVAAYAQDLPQSAVHLDQEVLTVSQQSGGVRVTTPTQEFTAKRVVLAIPPRIAAQVRFDPALPADQMHAMRVIPTWMAGHAKYLAIYDTPHWRDAGLSGDAQSRQGPMVEVHDASPATGGPYALFGFVGVDAATRAAHPTQMTQMAKAQLIRLFGPDMATPRALILQDWAQDRHTATQADRISGAHPDYGRPAALTHIWDGAVMLGSSEMGMTHGGYLEGALEAAQDVAHRVISAR